MLRIAIAEDLDSERDCLTEYVQNYGREKGLELALHIYSDGQELADAYDAGCREDLILLDIDMERMDGISTARKIRETDEQVQIVFITRMVQHALEGYEVAAADYIIKPVSYELFTGKIDRVMRRITDRADMQILIRTAGEQHYLRSNEISYAESVGKHVYIHLTAPRQGCDVFETRLPLYQLEKQMGEGFFRCHSAYLINLQAVTGYNATDVFLGETSIPLSKHRRREFVQALTAYHMKRG